MGYVLFVTLLHYTGTPTVLHVSNKVVCGLTAPPTADRCQHPTIMAL